MTIRPIRLRDLDLEAPSAPGRPAHLSAASGLVRAGDRLYVVADDEHHLGVFPATGTAPGTLVRLFPGALPDGKEARKAVKPDLEALAELPPFADHPHGALLALPSGSKPNRRTGALLALAADGTVLGEPRAIDVGETYAELLSVLPQLNVEGAFVHATHLCLVQRGSRKDPRSALVRLDLAGVLDALARGASIGVARPLAVDVIALGEAGGHPLGLSDATALPDGRIVVTAITEDAADSYADGPCGAAAVGLLAPDGRLLRMTCLEPTLKIEGVAARLADGGAIELLLVTDPDDAQVSGVLYGATLDGERAT